MVETEPRIQGVRGQSLNPSFRTMTTKERVDLGAGEVLPATKAVPGADDLLDRRGWAGILATPMSQAAKRTIDRRHERVGVIGAGRLGTAVAWHCHRLGFRIAGVADKRPKQAWVVYSLLKLPYERMRPVEVASGSDVLFITTPDSSIEPEFQSVRRSLVPGAIVVHCAGAMGVDAFKGAVEQGLDVLAMHPAQTFASHAQAIQALPGSLFALEGSRRGLAFGRRLARLLRGDCVLVKGRDRALYHAVCVFASNFLNGLFAAVEVGSGRLGISRRKAARAFVPLARVVLENIAASGAANSLTGPVERGDWQTVARHVAALEERAPGLVPAYRVLSRQLLGLARRRGLADEAARRLRRVLAER